MRQTDAPAITCRHVVVRYGDVVALDGIDLALERGRIHSVVGQNGAGKTTFARVVAGIVQPSEGSLLIGDKKVAVGSVEAARAAGVELVHQSFALPRSFTVAEAMEFGSRRHAGWPFTRRSLERRWTPHLRSLGIDVGPGEVIRDLPVETQQAVEIARALVTRASVLILDEPTAVLAPSGIEVLFQRLRALRESGVTIILILHKIREVLAIAETVTVLRGGRLVEGPMATSATTPERLATSIIGGGDGDGASGPSAADASALVGATLRPRGFDDAHRAATGPAVMQLKGLSTVPDDEGMALADLSFSIARGEIVGIVGVEGNGQRALVRALAALVPLKSGRIELGGVDVTRMSLIARRRAGLRIIPFERNLEGLSLSSSLWENWAALQLLLQRGLRLIRPAHLRAECHRSLKRWNVHFASTNQNAGSLSGGNAQKVILARELGDEAQVVVAAQPTRGLDVGASAFVWSALRAIRDRRCGVLMISSDLDEVFDISDRIVVMTSGKVAGVFQPPYNVTEVGAAMTGITAA